MSKISERIRKSFKGKDVRLIKNTRCFRVSPQMMVEPPGTPQTERVARDFEKKRIKKRKEKDVVWTLARRKKLRGMRV